jgi:phosphoserine phosphatase
VDGSLVLVRHGESIWIAEHRFQGQADPVLSPLGERQAALVGARLADPTADPALPLPATPPIGIWHSTLARAASTAGAINAARGNAVAMHPDTRLMELAQGAWEGLTATEVNATYGAELAAWREDPLHHWAPGGESIAAGAVRVRAAMGDVLDALRDADMLRDGPGDQVLGYGVPSMTLPWAIVTAHDGILRLALLELLGVPLERYWAFPYALCAVTIIEISSGRARLRAHNLDEHLAVLAVPAAATGAADRGGAL